jgi:hypothetical protein
MSRYWLLLPLAAALLAGCATSETGTRDIISAEEVQRFSAQAPGEALPQGWQPWILSSFKRPTEYRLVQHSGRTVVRADAVSSASGLVHPLRLNPAKYPLLQWQWKVDALVDKADNTQKHLEDAPARLVVSFDGDMEKLPLQDRMFFDNVRLLTGRQMPYATLMYIWANAQTPRETVIHNHHSARVRMIVVESGSERLGDWQQVTRNVLEDYRRAFGEEPGRITGVGIMTDTDNTGSTVHAYYGDISFRRARVTSTATTD